jgi:hypothetical protein
VGPWNWVNLELCEINLRSFLIPSSGSRIEEKGTAPHYDFCVGELDFIVLLCKYLVRLQNFEILIFF